MARFIVKVCVTTLCVSLFNSNCKASAANLAWLKKQGFSVEKKNKEIEISSPVLPFTLSKTHFFQPKFEITEEFLEKLVVLKTLNTLDLSFSDSNDLDLKIISKIKSLKKITLVGTRVSEKGLNEFIKQNPSCSVVSDLLGNS